MSECHKILSVKKLRRKYGAFSHQIVFYQLTLDGLPVGRNVVTLPYFRFCNQAPKEGKFAYWGPTNYPVSPYLLKFFGNVSFEQFKDGFANVVGLLYKWVILNDMTTDTVVCTHTPCAPVNYCWQVLRENGSLERIK